MRNIPAHNRWGRSISFGILTIGILFLFVTSCSAPSNSLKPGEPCPVTPVDAPNFLGDEFNPAGKYPIWLNIGGGGPIPWQQLGSVTFPSSPYEGRTLKQLWVIADEIQGKVRITGKQLDGKGKVLFPNDSSVEWINDTTAHYKEKPKAALIIDTATQDHRIVSPKPEGYTFFGSSFIFPHPGCYQFTATIDDYTVNIVEEIKDEWTWLNRLQVLSPG